MPARQSLLRAVTFASESARLDRSRRSMSSLYGRIASKISSCFSLSTRELPLPSFLPALAMRECRTFTPANLLLCLMNNS